jgi:hypothetical protein
VTELRSAMDLQGPLKGEESWNFKIQKFCRLERILWTCYNLCLGFENLIKLDSVDKAYGQEK